MEGSQKIIFNTGVTYLRFVITIFLAFYTTRLTLEVLGVKDFGLYNVIGGIVAMVAFLNTALSQATQRFLSYAIGSKDEAEVKKVFANSILIHAGLAVIILLGLEGFGIYYVNNVLNVEPDRILAANFLLQFSIVSTLLTIISVPYDALLFAHENMLFIALLNLFDAVAKLLTVLGLMYVPNSTIDTLIAFAFMIMISSLLNRIIMQIYVRKKYKQSYVSNLIREFDRAKIREQANFAGWNLLNVVGYIARNSGLALVLNAFMGTRINASYAVGNQIANQARFFSNTLAQAVTPQIIKNEGGNNRQSMIKLSLLGSRYGVLLISLIAIPIIFHIDAVLVFWLKQVPEYTALMSVMLLIAVVMNQFTAGLETMVYAIGDIKIYSICLSIVKISAVPLAYFVFFLNYENSVFIIFLILIAIEVFTFFFRILYVKFKGLISFTEYFKVVVLRIILPLMTYILFTYYSKFLPLSLGQKITVMLLIAIVYLIMIYRLTLEDEARKSVRNMIKMVLKKLGLK